MKRAVHIVGFMVVQGYFLSAGGQNNIPIDKEVITSSLKLSSHTSLSLKEFHHPSLNCHAVYVS